MINMRNMRRKRNMHHMKEKGKNQQDQMNEEETGNRPQIEFTVMTVKMIQNLRAEWRQELRKHKKCLTKISKN